MVTLGQPVQQELRVILEHKATLEQVLKEIPEPLEQRVTQAIREILE